LKLARSKPNARYWLNLSAFALIMLALFPCLLVTGFSYLYMDAFTQGSCLPPSRTPADIGLAHYEQVTFHAPPNITLHGWYVPSASDTSASGRVIVLVPGWGGARDGMLDDAALLARHGYGVLMYDARVCSVPGLRNTLGYAETDDLLGAVTYLSQRPDVRRIGALGFSEGGVIVIRGAARDERIRAVVSEGGFHNLAEHILHGPNVPLVRRLVEWQVAAFYWLQTGVNPADVSPITDVGRIGPRPVLLVYGEHEAERGGAQLPYDAAREPKELWIVPGAGHGGYIGAAPQEYERRVIAFFGQAG